MKYALITPLNAGPLANPGWQLITAGIKYWLRERDPAAIFTMIEMLQDDPEDWEIAEAQADKIVLCGNPRFNATNDKVYWDWDIWQRILHAMNNGIPFIDAWAGSAWPFDLYSSSEDIAGKLLAIPKNAEVLKHEARAELLIARDKPTELLFKRVNPNTQLLPCSSWHAAQELTIEPGRKEYNVIVLRQMPGYEWILDRARSLRDALKPCHIVVHAAADWKWAKVHGYRLALSKNQGRIGIRGAKSWFLQ